MRNPYLVKGVAYLAEYYNGYRLDIQEDFNWPEDPGDTVSITLHDDHQLGWVVAVLFFSAPVDGKWYKIIEGLLDKSKILADHLEEVFSTELEDIYDGEKDNVEKA